jgi:hypothetical protein
VSSRSESRHRLVRRRADPPAAKRRDHAHAHTRSRRGKTDAIDAEAARKVLAGECIAIPKDTTGIVEAVRQLHVARAGAVQARTAAGVPRRRLRIVEAGRQFGAYLAAAADHLMILC